MNETEPIENENAKELTGEESEGTSPDGNKEEPGSRFHHYFTEEQSGNAPKLTEVLQTFLRLKEIDGELTEIEEERGDLPESIENLKSACEKLKKEYATKKGILNSLVEEKSSLEESNKSYEQKISKYDEQKYNVRSNEEYDEITKAVDLLFEEVKKNEARLKEIENILSGLDVEIEELEEKIASHESEIEEKQGHLDELNEQYKQDEASLREKRAEEIEGLEEPNRYLYEKVNRMYRGEAAAIVRKGNCSGCYNSIPPQRVIEIRAAEKIFTCQSCGRILISEELVGNE